MMNLNRLTLLLSLLIPLSLSQLAAFAQAPVPGQVGAAPVPAPVPGQSAIPSHAGRPGSSPVPSQSSYQQLPLSVNDAQSRLDELKSLLPETRPQEMREPIYQLAEWLADLADGHNRLANSFARNEATKPQADTERRSAQRFASLKNQAQLLKADLLIKERRFPEALGPLVEIVAAEPRSATGQAAYRRLREIGFAEEAEVKPVDLSTSTPPQSPVSASTEAPTVRAVSQKPQATAPGKTAKAPATVSKAAASSSHRPHVWISGSPVGKR